MTWRRSSKSENKFAFSKYSYMYVLRVLYHGNAFLEVGNYRLPRMKATTFALVHHT